MTKTDGKFKFFVNDAKFEVEQKLVTGSQIKSLAGVDLNFELFLEEPGENRPDHKINDSDSIDLSAPGVEKFYTVPVATFGDGRCRMLS